METQRHREMQRRDKESQAQMQSESQRRRDQQRHSGNRSPMPGSPRQAGRDAHSFLGFSLETKLSNRSSVTC